MRKNKDFGKIDTIFFTTDYNVNFDDNKKPESTLYTTLKYFKKFQKENTSCEFYNWLNQHTDYIKDNELLQKTWFKKRQNT